MIKFVVLAATKIELVPDDSGKAGTPSLPAGLGFPPNGLRREKRLRLSGLESGLTSKGAGLLGLAIVRSPSPGTGKVGGRTTAISWGGFTTNSSGTWVTSMSDGLLRTAGGSFGVSTGGGLAAMTNGFVCPWFVWRAVLGGTAVTVGGFVRMFIATTLLGGRLDAGRAARLVRVGVKLLL